MGAGKPNKEGLSIVLLGDFNPKIFQPAWFAAQEPPLIPKLEAEDAKIEIIHPDVVVFEVEWFRLQVTRDRFFISTTQESRYEFLRDLVLGAFQLLQHTPVRAMGINKDVHWGVENEESWHEFGHRVAPKDVWSGILEKPGLLSLTMHGVRTDDHKGYINVKVEPSSQIQPGIYCSVNDHYEVKEPETVMGCNEMIDILRGCFYESIKRSDKIVSDLMRKS
jgi:hypothetical protein